MHRLTYLNSHLKNGKLIRWPEQCFPLNVYIAPCSWYSMSESDKYAYMNMVKEALRIWEYASGGKVSFQIVRTLNESQINVEWRRVDRKSLGNCGFNYDTESRLYSAEVSIGISDGIIHKKYMDENEVFHTILHEIGHALGLGHSTHPSDIMYTPHQYGVVSLTQRDIDSINWLYSLPFGCSAKNLSEAYGLNFNNIDDIIMKLEAGPIESEFEKIIKNAPVQKRDLEEEQARLAEIKKFQMTIQNFRLPKEISDKFKGM
ncbi:MAG: matrixin family metalloprotease [Cyanobacteria bacterium SIG29]|nr:matrixin family metalloprotease [Cyanobacteria bacterium SIG29]